MSSDNISFLSRVTDAVNLARDKCADKYIGFLDEKNVAECLAALKSAGHSNYAFFGGYDGAERVMLGVFCDYTSPEDAQWPIEAITLTSRPSAELTHRDYLGSLMSLGIKRETVGDILCEKSRAVIFVSNKLAEHICLQLTKVGGEGVSVRLGYDEPLPIAHSFAEISDTVASMRLDCVVASLCSVSRSKAEELISSSLVSVCGLVQQKYDYTVKFGNTISVRGKGRFIVDESPGTSKKGRIIFKARKYL